MKHQILSFLLIAWLGPVALNQTFGGVMLFDVRRVPSVGEMIVREALTQGVPAHLALAIAWRESKFQVGARHVNANGSVDAGLFQLNSRYHLGAEAMSAAENIRAGVAFVGKQIRWCHTQDGAAIRFAYISGHCLNSRLERK